MAGHTVVVTYVTRVEVVLGSTEEEGTQEELCSGTQPVGLIEAEELCSGTQPVGLIEAEELESEVHPVGLMTEEDEGVRAEDEEADED